MGAEFTFQKGFLWVGPLPAATVGSIADALISFPQSSRQWPMDEQEEEEEWERGGEQWHT